MKRSATALFAGVLFAFTLSPVEALAPGPPFVSMRVLETTDPFTYHLIADASDPDGRIQSIEICVDESGSEQCRSETFGRPAGAVRRAWDCVRGDAASFAVTHTFSAEGVFAIRANVRAGGCPVVGNDESAETHGAVVVATRPIPVPCLKPGVPTASDVGVTRGSVRVGVVASLSGPASQGGRAATRAIQIAADNINASGGVCDRMLGVAFFDDASDPVKGRAVIQRIIGQGAFALMAMPAYETLAAAIEAGDIDEAGIPAVGTSGATLTEFTSPWVWPVGPSSRTFAQSSVHHAYEQGARRFAVVWQDRLPWSIEAREEIVRVLASLPESAFVADVMLDPEESSYGAEAATYNARCEEGCDGVIMALLPHVADRWLRRRPKPSRVETSLSPHLLTESFPDSCAFRMGSACDGFLAWTGFEAPIPPAGPATARYAGELRAAGVDPIVPSTEAAYVGTFLFAHAIGRVGVDLTRAGLRALLDSEEFPQGFTAHPLSWKEDREANRAMRAYAVRVEYELLGRWEQATGWRETE